MTPAARIPALDHLGNIPATYRHEWKVATAVDTLVLPDRYGISCQAMWRA